MSFPSFNSFSSGLPNPSTTSPSESPIQDGDLVDERCIPTGQAVFFDNWTLSTPLPSPTEVRNASHGLTGHIILRRPTNSRRQHVVCFPTLQLVVKYGDTSTTPVSEAQTLWLLSFVTSIRVPKVYGWCEDGGERFIYMEHVQGITVEERWPSLSALEKLAVVDQLSSMVSSMTRLRQSSGDKYIGALLRGHILEHVWNGIGSPLGPFDSVRTFKDELFALGCRVPGYPDSPFFQSLRNAFSDDASIVFTHCDLHPGNIVMSPTSTDVLAIVDWHGSGWFPEFWEYIKAFFTVNWKSDDDWKDHIAMFVLPAYEDESDAFDALSATGCLI